MHEPTSTPTHPSRRRRRRGERGIALAMAALVIIPLMVFAAFGVDLAAWYARISEMQRTADAAALAGAVWMPNLDRARIEANASMRSNGFVNGSDNIVTSVERGATPTSVRVTITDNDVDRYFSTVFRTGAATLTRFAEAEYNLPLPLGSPLNYFGGDATRTVPPTPPTEYSVAWPLDYTTRVPANPSCNVGTSSGQGLGRWSGSPPSYNASGFSGSTVCVWTVALTTGSGTTNIPPPDYNTRVPTNGTGTGCRVLTNGTGASIGRWTGNPATFSTSTFGSMPACTWTNVTTDSASVPSFATTTAPVNRPCRVGYETTLGWWPSTGAHSTTSVPSGGASGTGNQLCRWSADITSFTPPTPPNPIDSSRSPGFWAAIEGPQTNAYQGEIYSTRCYGGGPSCSGVQNAMYLPPGDANRGYWYVVKIPSGLTGTVAINIFDGSYVQGSTQVRAGDRGLDGSSTVFPTRFQMYEQNNPLDYTQRTALFTGSPNTTDGSCNWELNDEAGFSGQWRNLCTLTGVTGGDLFLLNVQTVGTSGAGVNGYAIEAVANGSHAGIQPSLYAFGSMAMQNNNFCGSSPNPPCPPPNATFYLAEVAPQYAGKVLVMELWDPGDVSGTATMTPMMPSTTVPRPVVPVSALNCTFTADTTPNVRLGISGTEYTTPQPSDHGTECRVNTSTSSGIRFQGEWLRIRINVPEDYTCTQGANPETTAGSCWWGIRYAFSASANDVTTWQARVEGNPLQLTQ